MLFAWLLCVAQTPQVTGLHTGESVTLVDPSVIPAKDERHLFVRPRVLDALTGAPLEGVKIETWSENGMPPSCAQMRLDVAFLEGVVPLKPPDQPIGIVLTHRARLEIAGKVTLVDGFLGGSEATDSGIVMDVAAGPLSLVLARENQPPIALDLVLAPNDSRRIEVR